MLLRERVACIIGVAAYSPVGITVPPGTAVTEKGDVHNGIQMLRLKTAHTFQVECWCLYRV